MSVQSSNRIIASVSEEYFSAAVRELHDVFGNDIECKRLGPDLIGLSGVHAELGEVADICRSQPVVFVRHLTREFAKLDVDESNDLGKAEGTVFALVKELDTRTLALQAWSTGRQTVSYGPADLARRLTEALATQGFSVRNSTESKVVSVCLTPGGLVIGHASKDESLADWPGGRVRLARPKAQVSRAEFKLEELFKIADLPLPKSGRALDLGAAPGGWTRILRQRGLSVTAVDAGDLDPRVAADRQVRQVRTTAGAFLRSSANRAFDVIVNDMKMDPSTSIATMLDASQVLRAGGLAIITLKITPRDALREVRESIDALTRSYRIVFARQLHHNRNEVTLAAVRL